MVTDNQSPQEEDSIKKKLNTEEKSSFQNEWSSKFSRYFKSNGQEILVYVLLIIGLISFLVSSPFGSLIIGVIFGYYFSDEIAIRFKQVRENIEHFGHAKAITLLVSLFLVFMSIPVFFLGALVVVLLKQWLNKSS